MNDAASEAASLEDASLEDGARTAAHREMQRERRRRLLRILAVVVLAGALAWGLWYVLIGRNSVSTDNAYVNAEMAQVTPLIAGTAIEVRVKDTQEVKAGDVLVVLDAGNAQVALAQAEAELAAARRRFRQALATGDALSAQVSAQGAAIAESQARLAGAQAMLAKAEGEARRRAALEDEGIASREEVANTRAAADSARAEVARARAAVAAAMSGQRAAAGELAAQQAVVRGSTEDTDPAVRAARAKVDSARLDLERTVVRAPVSGVVTRRQVQVGQRVNLGQPVMTIVPLDRLYVDANFKERQLRRVRVGMPAKVTADIYGSDVVYSGKVAGIAGGTGSSMALIPAQNATGNWIKVVQRLPVRIELDPRQLQDHPLRMGLSAEVEIDLSGN